MPATPVWLAAAEAALNRSIQARSRAIALTQRLEGKTLEIDVTGVFRLRAACHGGRLALGLGQPADPAAATPKPRPPIATCCARRARTSRKNSRVWSATRPRGAPAISRAARSLH
jgi:ubiquinone biosynthesis protein UbiJ